MPRAFPPAPPPRPLLARAVRAPDPDTPAGRRWAAHLDAGRIGTPVAPAPVAARGAATAQFRRWTEARP
ncbi:hypothetical protein ACBY01_13270 [Sphingomonas sp. ac-8]|uniref:hypothetical protein n=1 Tax=Sphingomonas sp. ac-8 TaxID=3242977 RepID=UPI003A80100C